MTWRGKILKRTVTLNYTEEEERATVRLRCIHTNQNQKNIGTNSPPRWLDMSNQFSNGKHSKTTSKLQEIKCQKTISISLLIFLHIKCISNLLVLYI